MKLINWKVKQFRSVWDSKEISVDDRVTCLVGKNEAGKTSLLTALYRTNPIISSDANFELDFDYPKKRVEDYRHGVENDGLEEVSVVTCQFQLEQKEIEAVEEIFGTGVLPEKTFGRSTYYGRNKSTFTLKVNEDVAIKNFKERDDYSPEISKAVSICDGWNELVQTLTDNDADTELVNIVNRVAEKGLGFYIFNEIISPLMPKFLYFDEYYQLKGCENLDSLNSRIEKEELISSDYPLLGLINLARLNPTDLASSTSTTHLKNKLEGAGNHLTGKIIKFWSQNKHIQMRFDVREAKQDDPEGMQKGTNIWGEVYDTIHLASTSLGSRSRGFIWFFSFLAWYEDVKKNNQNVILLLDEPGLSLHGKAQADLLEYFEEGLEDHQVIYTTHSPFMVDSTKFDRVRIVQDASIDLDSAPDPDDNIGTEVVTNIFDASDDSLFPLQGALGYEVQQSLFVGANSLVVEGVSDMLFLKAISAELEREGKEGLSNKWVITPVGGIGKVSTFVSLLRSQKGMNICTLLDIQEKDSQLIDDLYKSKILKKKQVLTYADFINSKEADIEDLFEKDFYVGLVNQEFSKQLSNPIQLSDLNSKIPRVVVALEKYLEKNPLKSGEFGHYRPARYFTENIHDLWKEIEDSNKTVFVELFSELNKLVK